MAQKKKPGRFTLAWLFNQINACPGSRERLKGLSLKEAYAACSLVELRYLVENLYSTKRHNADFLGECPACKQRDKLRLWSGNLRGRYPYVKLRRQIKKRWGR